MEHHGKPTINRVDSPRRSVLYLHRLLTLPPATNPKIHHLLILLLLHSEYKNSQPSIPHRMVVDLGETTELTGIRYLPRAGSGTPGRIKDYRVYV